MSANRCSPALPPDALKDVEHILNDQPPPQLRPDGTVAVDPAWFTAASTRSVELARRRSPTLAYEIQAVRIGETVIVGLPGDGRGSDTGDDCGSVHPVGRH